MRTDAILKNDVFSNVFSKIREKDSWKIMSFDLSFPFFAVNTGIYGSAQNDVFQMSFHTPERKTLPPLPNREGECISGSIYFAGRKGLGAAANTGSTPSARNLIKQNRPDRRNLSRVRVYFSSPHINKAQHNYAVTP